MTLSIRWKVALAIVFALVCGFVIAGVLTARSLAEQELAQTERALEVSTNLIAFDLRPLVTGAVTLAADTAASIDGPGVEPCHPFEKCE